MTSKDKRINAIIQEAISGDMNSPASMTQITKFNDNPVVKEILEYFEENIEDAKIINIVGNGDVWQLDVRADVEPQLNAQETRGTAKDRAYQIKRGLEGHMMTKFNLPAMSISGLRSTDQVSEFTISFIYANKGNVRVNYEAKTMKIHNLIEQTLTQVKNKLD